MGLLSSSGDLWTNGNSPAQPCGHDASGPNIKRQPLLIYQVLDCKTQTSKESKELAGAVIIGSEDPHTRAHTHPNSDLE